MVAPKGQRSHVVRRSRLRHPMPIVAAYRGELDWFPSHGPSRAGARIVLFRYLSRGAIEMGIGAPAEMLRAVEDDLLYARLEDHVGVRADPGTARSHIP